MKSVTKRFHYQKVNIQMLKKCWLEKVISEFTVHIVTIYYISCFYMQADLTFGVKHLYTFFTICTYLNGCIKQHCAMEFWKQTTKTGRRKRQGL